MVRAASGEAPLGTLPGVLFSSQSSSPSISADGHLVGFASHDSTLVPGDANGAADVFVWDRETKQTSLVSVSSQGSQGNAISLDPVLSADERYVAFTSLADNLVEGDSNGTADVFLHELASGHTELISSAPDGTPGNGWSGWPALSADGRSVVFWSRAGNLAEGNGKADIYVRDRLTGKTRRIPVGEAPSLPAGIPYRPAISADGRTIAFAVQFQGAARFGSAGQPAGLAGIFLHDQLTGQTAPLSLPNEIKASVHSLSLSRDGRIIAFAAWKGANFSIFLYSRLDQSLHQIPGSQAKSSGSLAFDLSSDGRSLVYLSTLAPSQGEIYLYDVKSGLAAPLEAGRGLLSSTRPTLSFGGRYIAFIRPVQEPAHSHPADGISIYDRGQDRMAKAAVSGWVSDGLGHPLAGVLVSVEFGLPVTTGADGSFTIGGLPPGGYNLTPQKAGFIFSPPSLRVRASPELPGAMGLAFTGVPQGVVDVARMDIGMPYSAQRGCPSPLKGCGGPYNGFFQGGCTDVVLDGYRLGAEFNIQVALEIDFKKHPNHYYSPGNSRRAWDMWRYFFYSNQVLRHDEPYLPGDIVFFDWNGDGVLDHVSLVSQVDEQGRPLYMIDATGEITNNPQGLAGELAWVGFHEAHVTGHARWTGTVRLDEPLPDPRLPILLVALDSPTVSLRLLDAQGRAITQEGSSISGGAYRDMIAGKLISLNTALKDGDTFTLEIASPVNAPYQLGIQIVQAGVKTVDSSYIRTITAGEVQQIHIQITLKDGKIVFLSPDLE